MTNTTALRTRVERIERREGVGAGRVWLMYQGFEPEPVDVPADCQVISLAFVSTGDDGPRDVTPVLDLSVPLPPEIEAALARRDADGMSYSDGYHRWDAVTREFVSPFGLRRPALPRPSA